MSAEAAADHGDLDHHDDHDHKLPFYKKYIWSTDHKVIGIQYGLTALLFLAFASMLIAAAWIDIDHRIIPDALSLGGLAVGIVLVPIPRS